MSTTKSDTTPTASETDARCRGLFCMRRQNENEKEKELPWFDLWVIILAMLALFGVYTMAIIARPFVAWIANIKTYNVELLPLAAFLVWLVYELEGMIHLVRNGKWWAWTLVRVIAILVYMVADVLYVSYFNDWVDPYAAMDSDNGGHRPRLYEGVMKGALFVLLFGVFASNRTNRYIVPTPACCANCCAGTGAGAGENESLTQADKDRLASLSSR